MLKIGFIGCGGIARHHAARIKDLKNARIVAASDVVAAAAESFASDFGAEKHFDDYRKLLRADDIDAVWVCTPTFQHAQPVIAAARAGKHVFCEKPMALKVADAERMAEACDKAGVLLTVGFVRRFDTFWGKFKQVVQSGAVGNPVIWRFAAGGKPARAWFRDVKKGGGPLIDGAIHNYDFALQVFGPVASVQASSLQFDKTSVGADTASAILNFKSGDQHSLIWSWGVAAGAQVAGLNDIIGPKGSLQFGMTAKEAPKSFNPETHGAFTLKAANGREKVYPYRKEDMFVEQAKHVVRSFERGEQPLVTAQDGIAALKVAAAVLEAGRKQSTIKIR
jgi:UDP-N-acetylglucosamine 3-dehydrogenase